MPEVRVTRSALCLRMVLLSALLAVGGHGFAVVAQASENAPGKLADRPAVHAYLKAISAQHDLDYQSLQTLFAGLVVQQDVIELISRPAERTLEWHEYRAIFLTDRRIQAGLVFMRQYRELLAAAEKAYGVPAELIAAIFGVETFYGRITGKHLALPALATLAFEYPPRAEFFRRELTEFLLLAREEGFDPAAVKGSYAAAMGLPQFISSSYRQYAVDFDADGRRDLWDSPADAIGSVGNYLARHGWQAGEAIAERLAPANQRWRKLVVGSLKPTRSEQMLKKAGIDLSLGTPGKKSVMSFMGKDGVEAWVGHQNFYVITRYNHSRMYALAVFQLSQALRDAEV